MSAARPAPINLETVTFQATVAHFEVFDGSLCGAGVLKGDTAVVLLNTPDIQPGDLVLVHTPEGLRVLQYHPAPGDRVKLSTLEFKKSRRWTYTRTDAVVLGRVVQFAWEGKEVQTLVKVRPIC
jgi:uncharacterized protein YcnI